MIPFAAVIYFLCGIIISFSVLTIWKKKRSTFQENEMVHHFFFIYLLAGIFFFLESIPTFLTANGLIIQTFFIIGDSLMVLVALLLSRLSIRMLLPEKFKNIQKIMAGLFGCFSFFYFSYNFYYLKPAILIFTGSSIFWRESVNPNILYIHGIILGLSMALIVAVHTIKGWRHKDDFIRKRSRLMVTGSLFAGVGAALTYFANVIIPPKIRIFMDFVSLSIILSGIFVTIGFLTLLKSILLKRNGTT